MGLEMPRSHAVRLLAGAAVALSFVAPQAQEGARFRGGVELINVTATVTDGSGRFVSGLGQSDFRVYDDGQPVDVTYFSAERAPVSLGIVLDASGSMAGDKLANARGAIERFLDQLFQADDEVFLVGFASDIDFIQDWTSNRDAVSASLRRIRAVGGTAMYDALIEAVPTAQRGRNGKKAVVLISDGNDTNSRADVRDVRRLVRESEVMVYAVGIDGKGEPTLRRPPRTVPPGPIPFPPFPLPGRGRPRWPVLPQRPQVFGTGILERLNVSALREITDDSGGRTEVVRSAQDLDPATSSIADELSQQYHLGYPSPDHDDGRWHGIRVEMRDPALRVRARQGYTASRPS